MPYTLKTNQISVKDPETGEYSGVDILTEQTEQGLIAELQAEGTTQVNRINQAAVDVQAAVDQAESDAATIISSTQSSINTLEAQKNTIAQTVASMAELGTDTTLSTPGMAADAATVGDLNRQISDVKNAIDNNHNDIVQIAGGANEIVSNPHNLIWTRGTINATTGEETSSTTRLVSSKCYFGTCKSLTFSSTLRIVADIFDENDTLLNPGQSFGTSAKTIVNTAGYSYVRFLLAKTGDATINVGDAAYSLSVTYDNKTEQRFDIAEDDIDSIIDQEEITMTNLSWERGSINPSTGAMITSEVRIRTESFDLTGTKELKAIAAENYSVLIGIYYTEEGTTKYFNSGWGQTHTIKILDNYTSARVLLKKSEDTSISVSAKDNATVKKLYKISTVVGRVEKLEESNVIHGNVFQAEVKSTVEGVQTVLASSGVPMLTIAVFTDLHHDNKYTNDPTQDMMSNIRALDQRLHFDAVINLGDAIDGMFQTQYQAEGALSEVVTAMYAITERSHNVIGNHDNNALSTEPYKGNQPESEKLTLPEINDALFKGSNGEVHNPNHITDYYVDYDLYGVRVICLGLDGVEYNSATQTWLENTALQTDKKVLVFSHCATKAKWGFNNDIQNGSYIEEPLNDFIDNGGTVVAYIHGHTHGDMIETDSDINFTEVAIGCAKFEKLTSGTTGITYQDRSADDYTKILFDIVCVDQTNSQVHFIRCGAGTDRYISY